MLKRVKPLYDWEAIRAEYEAGSTMGELSRTHGVSKQAISKKARAEGWMQDASEMISRLAQAKVDGLVDTVNPKKKAEAVNHAADRKAEIMQRHRDAWPAIKKLNADAVSSQDFDLAKLAKISAETEKIIQEGERRAWGITEVQDGAGIAAQTAVRIDLGGMKPDEIAAMARAVYRGK